MMSDNLLFLSILPYVIGFMDATSVKHMIFVCKTITPNMLINEWLSPTALHYLLRAAILYHGPVKHILSIPFEFVLVENWILLAARVGNVEALPWLFGDARVQEAIHFLSNIVRKPIYGDPIGQALRVAAQRGYIDVVGLVIERSGYDNGYGIHSILEVACRRGDADMLRLVLAKTSKRDTDMDHLFYTVVKDNRIDMIQIMLDAGLNPHDTWAFYTACSHGHLEIVRLLLADPRINVSDEADWSELDVVKLLLADGRADPSYRDNSAVVSAASRGDMDILNLLLKHPRVDPSVRDNAAIRIAVKNRHFSAVCRLLRDDRVDPSEDCNYCIRKASENGDHDIVRNLLRHPNVDPSDTDNEALKLALARDHHKVVTLLLNDGRTRLSEDEDLHILWKAIEKGAGFGGIHAMLKHFKRKSPVLISSSIWKKILTHGRLDLVRLLMGNKFKVNPSVNNNEAIRIAARHGYYKIVEFLIEDDRVDVCVNNNEPLRMAARFGHYEVVQLLVDSGKVDTNNETLRMATRYGHRSVVGLLLGCRGVDANDREALQLAERYGHTEIVDLLTRYLRG